MVEKTMKTRIDVVRRQTIGKFLREARERAGLSQRHIAVRLGYASAQFVSNWERGIASPPLKSLGKLYAILGCRPEDLLRAFTAYRKKVVQLEAKQLERLLNLKAG